MKIHTTRFGFFTTSEKKQKENSVKLLENFKSQKAEEIRNRDTTSVESKYSIRISSK
jgi:hypothetical protein